MVGVREIAVVLLAMADFIVIDHSRLKTTMQCYILQNLYDIFALELKRCDRGDHMNILNNNPPTVFLPGNKQENIKFL